MFVCRSLVLFAFILVVFLTPSLSMAANNNSILSSKPISRHNTSKLPRWEEILSLYVSEIHNTRHPNITKWQNFIQSIQGETKMRQMLEVNRWFKRFPYKQDNWVYNQNDCWATPAQFLTLGGDCEDYAIIKYVTLRKLGFPTKDLKISMVYNVYSGTDHAFLVVKHQGTEFILDNREKVTVSRYMKKRYKPHYAFNEKHVWTYNSPVIVKAMRRSSADQVLPGNR